LLTVKILSGFSCGWYFFVPFCNFMLWAQRGRLGPLNDARMKMPQNARAFGNAPLRRRIKLRFMEPQHKIDSGVIVTADGKVVTADGLALKNVHLIEKIDTRLVQHVDPTFQSWQVCRMVRRDFNFVAAKLFHQMVPKLAKSAVKEQLRGLVHEVRLQAELLVIESQAFETNPDQDLRVVPLRLVSAASSSLYKAFVFADVAYGKLNYAAANRKISPDDVHDYAQDFVLAFSDLKNYSSKSSSPKSAHELGIAQGIA
jgi:hypothetical protein